MHDLRADASGGDAAAASAPAPVAGKQTLTESLPAPLQAKMEQSFASDFSSVQVHASSGEADAMGARAFARGNDVHFGAGEYDPGSHGGQELVGHELAHVVQQRSGRVSAPAQAKGVAPVVADRAFEAEADVAGARAARGEPAGLTAASTGVAAPVLQGYFKIDQGDFAKNKVTGSGTASFSAQEKPHGSESYLNDDGSTNIVAQTIATVGAIRVSDDGLLAIEDGAGRQSKTFFISEGLIAGANSDLRKTGSSYRLVKQGGTIKVPDKLKVIHELVQVVGQNQKDASQGDTLGGPVNCDAMATEVGGWGRDDKKRLKLATGSEPVWADEEGHRAAAFLVEYAKRKDDYTGKISGATTASQYATRKPVAETTPFYSVKVTVDDVSQFEALMKTQNVHLKMVAEIKDKEVTLGGLGEAQYRVIVDDRDTGTKNVKHIEITQQGEMPKPLGPKDVARALADQRDEIAQAYATMDPAVKAEIAAHLGVNEAAAPRIGDAFVTFSTGAKRDGVGVHDHETGQDVNAKWGQHWGGVVAKSGGDYITLENYDRQSEDAAAAGAAHNAVETRAFFAMYGSATGQTWHDIQKGSGEFPNAVSLAYQNPDRKWL